MRGIICIAAITKAKEFITLETSFISPSNEVIGGDLVDVFGDIMKKFASQVSDAEQDLPFNPDERCEFVGIEFKKGIECGEVTEIECALANVTKTRYELVERCKSKIEQKCSVKTREEPEQHCIERVTKRSAGKMENN